jgi:hypothetical protein
VREALVCVENWSVKFRYQKWIYPQITQIGAASGESVLSGSLRIVMSLSMPMDRMGGIHEPTLNKN